MDSPGRADQERTGGKNPGDFARMSLIKKAIAGIPTSELRKLISGGEVEVVGDSKEKPNESRLMYSIDVLSVPMDGSNYSYSAPSSTLQQAEAYIKSPGRLVSCRLAFPDLVVERSSERAFLKELTDQLRVAISGIAPDEPLVATMIPRGSDEDPAVAQISLQLFRADQLKALLETPALMAYTPLLKFGRFDHSFFQTQISASTTRLDYPAPEILARLDEMEKRYLEIRDKRNIIESYHEIMRRTNPYEARMEQFCAIEKAAMVSSSGGLGARGTDILYPGEDAPDQTEPVPTFPWSGVPGVLSPRAAQPPRKNSLTTTIYGDETLSNVSPKVRCFPPSADVVMTSKAMETALQHLAVDGVQLNAASSEISRRLEEAVETAELGRIAAAGLASPEVLEQLILQNTLRREQTRQKDEMDVLKAWTKNEADALTRENNLKYMQRLYAVATGDDEALAELERAYNIVGPRDLREQRSALVKKVANEVAVGSTVAGLNFGTSSEKSIIGMTFRITGASNLGHIEPSSELFVRLRVLNAKTGFLEAEKQTATVSVDKSDGWNLELYLESSTSDVSVECLLFQYNSYGKDVLLGKCVIGQVRALPNQVGIFVLDNGVSLGIQIDVADPFPVAYASAFPSAAVLPSTAYRSDLQSSVTVLRERNFDFVMDQVERVEDERKRLEKKVAQYSDLNGGERMPQLESLIEQGNLGKQNTFVMYGENGESGGEGLLPTTVTPPLLGKQSTLRQLEKPFPNFHALYLELLGFRREGRLGSIEGRQCAYDFGYVGQSQGREFQADAELMEYVALLSDVLVEYQRDAAVLVAGLGMLSVAFASLETVDVRRRQIAVVLWDAVTRSLNLGFSDKILAEQLLTAMAVVLGPSGVPKIEAAHIDFALAMFEKARETIQLEQIVQVIGSGGKSCVHRLRDQVRVVLTVLEKYRFSAQTVQRTLAALASVYSRQEVGGGDESAADAKNFTEKNGTAYPSDGSDIELIVVASGMYVDSVSVQVAVLEALRAVAGVSSANARRIENVVGPAVLDQGFERNKNVESVQLGVARLLLRLADLVGPGSFELPESILVLMKILSTGGKSKEVVLVSLAALRVCFLNLKKNTLLWDISEDPGLIVSSFVTSMESSVLLDASVARECCLTIEALVSGGSVEMRDLLTKSGVVAVPLKCFKTPSERLVKQILSCMHACVLASPRAAYQFGRLDGVQTLLTSTAVVSEWRAWAVLADASAASDETKDLFDPDTDIKRICEICARVGSRDGSGDLEIPLQAIRVVGEIAFNSSMDTKEIWAVLIKALAGWAAGGSTNVPLHLVVWALVSRKLLPKTHPKTDRMTSPNGRDLVFRISKNLVQEYNLWVTSGGGSEIGANVYGGSADYDEASTVVANESNKGLSRKATKKQNDSYFSGFAQYFP